MKKFLVKSSLEIPSNVLLTIRNKIIQVKGIKGKITKKFKFSNITIKKRLNNPRQIEISCFYTKKKEAALVRTIASNIYNMIIGVSRGFVYKLRLVYAHFPININYHHDKQLLEIRNYYGEKRLISFYISRRLQIILSESQDKEISLYSKDIETLFIKTMESIQLLKKQTNVRA